MHSYASRTLPALAATSAAATVLALAAPGASAAAATARRSRTGPIYTQTEAGYRAGFATGYRFRSVSTTFRVPSCSDPAVGFGWRGNGVELGANSSQWRAELGVGCDSGSGAAVDYILMVGGHPLLPVPLSLLPGTGDKVTLNVYYNRAAGKVRFAAGDDTRLDAVVRTVSVGTHAQYYGAEIGSQFASVSTPPVNFRTTVFSGCGLTTYRGRRGSLLGPWPTSQVIATTTGQADGDVIANAPFLWNRGRNFSVWERTTAHSRRHPHR
jgi:hypothetical protein